MEALILAGGATPAAFSSITSVEWEALVPICGRPMVNYVIAAVAQHPRVRRVRVVGPVSGYEGPVEYIPPTSGTLWDNLARGLETLPPESPILIATADIPLVTTAVIDRFLAHCPDRDVVYPIVPKEIAERRFPGVRRTYFRLREGSFTGGNLFLAKPGAILRARAHADRILSHRKRPWRLAGDIGFATLLKFLLRRLTLGDAERTAGRLLSIDGAALICDDPEVGVDVDKVSDLELVSRFLQASAEDSQHA